MRWPRENARFIQRMRRRAFDDTRWSSKPSNKCDTLPFTAQQWHEQKEWQWRGFSDQTLCGFPALRKAVTVLSIHADLHLGLYTRESGYSRIELLLSCKEFSDFICFRLILLIFLRLNFTLWLLADLRFSFQCIFYSFLKTILLSGFPNHGVLCRNTFRLAQGLRYISNEIRKKGTFCNQPRVSRSSKITGR